MDLTYPAERPFLHVYRVYAKFAAAVAIALGCAVLAGWQFHLEGVKSVLPGFATMKANTALCFILSGVSLWLLSDAAGPRPSIGKCTAARICAVLAGLIGLATLCEYLLDINFRIDEFLYPASPDSESPYPGRMSAATAFSSALLAMSLLLQTDRNKRRREVAQHVALLVIWVAFIALVGYAYGTPAPFGGASLPVASLAFTSMAVHTSLCFMLIGIGAFVLRPDRGLMEAISSPYLGGAMARRVLPLSAAAASCLFLLGIAGRRGETYNAGFVLSVLAAVIISALALVIWTYARSLNTVDVQRRQIKATIRQALAEKEVMLKEIHHRVKNNLQLVSSLLSLQSRQVPSEEMRKVFDESRARVHSMALIHEQLYKSPDLSHIGFADYLEELIGYILKSHQGVAHRVDPKINVENVPVSVDVAIPCALIINELVSNSLKYAFPGERSGEIRIDLHQTPDQAIQLRVGDNGAGFPPDLDPRRSPTLGLRLVRILANQLGGDVEFRNEQGAEVEVRFPSEVAA